MLIRYYIDSAKRVLLQRQAHRRDRRARGALLRKNGTAARLRCDRLEERSLLAITGIVAPVELAYVDATSAEITAAVTSTASNAGEAISQGAPKQGPGLIIRTDSVSLAVDSGNSQQGFIDVFLEVPPNASHRISGYEVFLSLIGDPAGVRFTGAEISSSAHPPLFPSQAPVVNSVGSSISVTDFLFTGDVLAVDGRGLFRAAFTVDPGVSGIFPLAFNTVFTNLADRQAQAVPIAEYLPGTVTVGSAQQPSISITDATVSEGDTGTTSMIFTVTLSGPASGPVGVDYTTNSGTATVGLDFLAAGGRLNFAVGETSKTATVMIVGDTLMEGNESLAVNLSNASGATIARGTATGTILDDDTVAAQHPWQNSIDPSDINNDGRVTPIDALLIINWINSRGSGALPIPPTPPDVPPPFVDPNGDDAISPSDALVVINRLNELATGQLSAVAVQMDTTSGDDDVPSTPELAKLAEPVSATSTGWEEVLWSLAFSQVQADDGSRYFAN